MWVESIVCNISVIFSVVFWDSVLKLLRSQGLSTVQLDQVSQAIIVSRLRYALPAWLGFLTVDVINRMQSTIKRLLYVRLY